MSIQGDTVVKHIRHHLEAVDGALAALFDQALAKAGYPEIAAATAIERLCADFLAGPPGPPLTEIGDRLSAYALGLLEWFHDEIEPSPRYERPHNMAAALRDLALDWQARRTP